MRLLEIGRDRVNHRVADLVERIHLGARLLVAFRDRQRGIVECIPCAVAAGECARRGLADMPDAERIDEAFE